MSRRVTSQSQMTDLNLVNKVVAAKGYRTQYDEGSKTLTFKSGPLAKSHLNLATGEFVGDSDHVTETVLGSLRQDYGVELVKQTVSTRGGVVESVVRRDANVVLRCSVSAG